MLTTASETLPEYPAMRVIVAPDVMLPPGITVTGESIERLVIP